MKNIKHKKSIIVIAIALIALLTCFGIGATVMSALSGQEVSVEEVYEWKIVRTGNNDKPLSEAAEEDFKLVAVLKNQSEKKVKDSLWTFENDGTTVTIRYKSVVVTYKELQDEDVINVIISSDVDEDDTDNKGLSSNEDSSNINPIIPNESTDIAGKDEDGKNPFGPNDNNENSSGGSEDGYFADDEIEKSPTVSITSMVIVQMPYKTDYIYGEMFNPEGLIIDVNISDGTVKRLTDISTYDKPLTTQRYVRITYSYSDSVGHVDVPVTVVKRVPESMTIVGMPNKTEYIEDTQFNPAGLKVMVSFDNGDTTEVKYTYPSSPLKLGQTAVPITYSEANTTVTQDIDITVNAKQFKSMKLTSKPKKTSYIQDTEFDKSGMTIEATYDNGLTYPLYDYKIKDNIVKLDTKEVTVFHQKDGIYDDVKVPVTVSAKTPTVIKIVGTPAKQIVGLPFNDKGLTVKAVFDNKSTEDIKDYSYSKELLTLEDKKITITASVDKKQFKADVAIVVSLKTPTALEILTPPDVTSFIEEQTFHKSGISAKVTYDNGETAVFDENDLNVLRDNTQVTFEDKTMTVSYTDEDTTKTVKAEQPITVIRRTPLSMQIAKAPDKINYIEEEKFVIDGMTVTCTFDNGFTHQIDAAALGFSRKEILYGTTQWKISYTENDKTMTVNQTITVAKKKPVSLTILTHPEKPDGMNWIEDETFSKSGLTASVKYNNGKYETLSADKLTVSQDGKSLAYGSNLMTASYSLNGDTVTADFNTITVRKKPIGITIAALPKTIYIEDDVLEISGIKTVVQWNNGKSGIIPESELVVSKIGEVLDIIDDGAAITVSFTYFGVTVTVEYIIEVLPKVPEYIFIDTPPTQTKYDAKRKFNSEGMAVKAHYNNGIERVINDYTYPNVLLTQGQTSVTLTYTTTGGTRTVDCPVTVGPAQAVYKKYTTKVEMIDTGEVPTGNTSSYLIENYYRYNQTYPAADKYFNITTLAMYHVDNLVVNEYGSFQGGPKYYPHGSNSAQNNWQLNPAVNLYKDAQMTQRGQGFDDRTTYPGYNPPMTPADTTLYGNNLQKIRWVRIDTVGTRDRCTCSECKWTLDTYDSEYIIEAIRTCSNQTVSNEYVETLTVTDGTYPENGISGSYWYVKQYVVEDTLAKGYSLRSNKAHKEVLPAAPTGKPRLGERIPYTVQILDGFDHVKRIPVYHEEIRYTAPYGSVPLQTADIRKI